MANLNIINLDDSETIPDNLILATDESGEETLRFGVSCRDKWIVCYYPTWGMWDDYRKEIYEILTQFGAECADIRLPDNLADKIVPKSSVKGWQVVTAAIYAQFGLPKKIENAFYTYLRPAVDGIKQKDLRKWVRDNATPIILFKFFAAFLRPDQWLKKKAQEILSQAFQVSPPQLSSDTYSKNSAGQNPIFTDAPFLGLH